MRKRRGRRPQALLTTLLTALLPARLMAADAPPAETPSTLQRVEVGGESSAAREQKTVAQLLAIRKSFEKHRKLAPQAELRIRLYPRHDDADLERLSLSLRAEGLHRPVPLDEQQRFEIDPAWAALPADTVLRSGLRDGRLAWHPDVRTPGLPPNTRRLGDLRLECHADLVGTSHLARGIVTPSYLALAALTDVCSRYDVYGHYADVPVFSITLVDGTRRKQLPYVHLHGSVTGQSHPLHALLDWPYRLRDRFYWLPLSDASWSDDTRVVLEPMDSAKEPS
ncbi:hypothetical protein QRD43_04795 [Pelomonas sp. APW6]|uniref:Lipoprotein n=1 Tax=Roseateles subflavus TaxID=3053353 RepID=A0ABT7LED3_9BURK|nr:hypothetical protein [Pelomonas sp. APW6]MDL5031218.1 hypothetical protein [Pelomonas sp. APW6]